MRITDPQVILNGEKDLIASVQKDVDLDAVRDLFKERLSAEALSPQGGQIVVHDHDVAFRLDYEINLNGSLLFDRNGNLLEDSESTAAKQDPQAYEDAVPAPDQDDNLSIDLPGYDEAPDQDTWEAQAEIPEPEALPDDFQDAEPGFEINDLEDELAVEQEAPDMLETDDGDERIEDLPKADDLDALSVGELTDLDLEEGDKETGQDVDDDISDLFIENLEDPSDVDQEDPDSLESDDGDERIEDLPEADDIDALSVGELTDLNLEEGDKETGQDVDDDISDILQENRDFWENKKE